MRKISKYLSMLLIVFMLVTLLSSCKKTDDEEDGAASSDVNSTVEGENSTSGNDTTGGNGTTGGDKTTGGNGTTGGDKKPNGNGTTGGNKNPSSVNPSGGEEIEKDGFTTNEQGDIINSNTEIEVDEDGVIKAPVDNNNPFIPDEEQGLEKSERRATEASKYSFDENPLINRDRNANSKSMPSFEIDDTGFVRSGTKISDLKGKTLVFYTADNYDVWSYRNDKGETIGERAWYQSLKKDIGLNIKYIEATNTGSIKGALQYMNAGKQCDIIYNAHVAWPMCICITRSITSFVNINNLGSSPGVCKKTMDVCKWGNTLRLIAPIGLVDVLWYNQTLAQQLSMPDPHVMWEQGKWNWDTFKQFLLSAPKTTQDGKQLYSFVHWGNDLRYTFPTTNGKECIKIDANAPEPALVNNWDDPLVVEAWEFICGILISINNGNRAEQYRALFEGSTLMTGTMYSQRYYDTEYSKNVQINWVPYPKSTASTGKDICQYEGIGMMLPRKTIKEDNVDIALKFMELWATRFTETIFDNLHTFEYFSFNYVQRKQYFDFVTKNTVFSLAMNDFQGSTINTDTSIYLCFQGDPAFNVKTEAAKASNLVKTYIYESLKYGQ